MTETITIQAAESGRRPSRGRIVHAHAIECADGLAQIRNACLMNCTKPPDPRRRQGVWRLAEREGFDR